MRKAPGIKPWRAASLFHDEARRPGCIHTPGLKRIRVRLATVQRARRS